MTEIDYAWAAGILEGEGCFSMHTRKARQNRVEVAIHCEMTDLDIVQRLKKIFGVGNISTRLNKNNRRVDSVRKTSYVWSVQNARGVFEVLLRVMPYLGERRIEKAQKLFKEVEKKVL